MNLLKKFLKTSGIYFLGKSLSFIVTFVMLKVYTANISTDGYGYYDLTVSYIQSLIPFVFIEIWSGMLRRVLFHKEKNLKERAIGTSFWFLIATLVFYCIGFVAFYIIFCFKAGILVFFYSLSYLFYSFFCILARALQRNKLFAISGVLGSVGNAIIGLVSIYIIKLDYESLFLSLISNYTIQVIIIFFFTKCWKYFRISLFDWNEAKALIKFCIPLALNTLVNYAYTGFYKTIIDSKLGTDALGVYTVSIKFASIITFVCAIFHLAWQEVSYSLSNDNNKTRVYIKGLQLFGYTVAVGVSVILPLIKIIFPIFIGQAFSEAASYVPYYYLYIYFFMINGFLYNILSAENETHILFVGKLIGTVFLLAFIIYFLPILKVLAIPIGIVIASIIEYAFLRFYAAKKHDIRFINISVIIVAIMYAIGCVIYICFNRTINFIWLVVAAVISLLLSFFFNREFIKSLYISVKR